MGCPRPVTFSLQSGPPDGRLSHSPGPSPLGIPRARKRRRAGVAQRAGDLESPQRSGHHRRERRDPARRDLQPPRPRRRPMAGRPGFSGRRCRARYAAVDRPGHVGRCSRRRQPVLEAGRRPEWASSAVAARHLSSRTQTTRHRGDAARLPHRANHHRTQPRDRRRAKLSVAQHFAGARSELRAGQIHVDSGRAAPAGLLEPRPASRGGMADSAAVGDERRWREGPLRRAPGRAVGHSARWTCATWQPSLGGPRRPDAPGRRTHTRRMATAQESRSRRATAGPGSDQPLPPPPTGHVFSTATRTEANA